MTGGRHGHAAKGAPGDKRPWWRRLLAWGVAGAALAGAAGVVGAAVVSRTATGREAALEWALAALRPSLNGSVTLESVGPGGLLGGATLHGLRVEDHLGRPVLTADSVRARYPFFDLLAGRRAVADLRLWSPVVVVRPGVEDLLVRNREAQAHGEAPPPDSAEARPLLRVRRARVHDGLVVLESDGAAPRRVDGIEADVERLDVSPGGGVHLAAELAAAALSYPARAGHVGLAGLRGSVTIDRNGVTVAAEQFRLAGSQGRGRVFAERSGPGWRYDLEASFSALALTDLAWIDPRLDRGVAAGDVRVVWEPGRLAVSASAPVDVDLGEAGRLSVAGEFSRGTAGGFRGLRVSAQGLAAGEVQRWTKGPLPVAGDFSGELRVDGSPGALALAGSVSLADGETGVLRAVATGSATLLSGWAFEDADVRLDPFDYALLAAAAPNVPWSGRGSLRVRADGAPRQGVAVEVEARHRALAAGDSSAVFASGTLVSDTAVALADFEVALAPLSLAAAREAYAGCPSASEDGEPGPCSPRLALNGAVRGALALDGPLNRLRVNADLETPGGSLSVRGHANLRDPADGYEIAASFDEFRLSEVLPSLPRPTTATGSLRASGRGLDRASLQGVFAASLRTVAVGRIALDSASATARVENGALHVEALRVDGDGISLEGRGGLGLAAGVRGEGLDLSFSSASIRPLRPLFMDPDRVARGELTEIERRFHDMEGADTDTFPTPTDVRMEGAARGRIALSGGLDELSVQVAASLDGPAYGWHSAAAAAVEASMEGVRLLDPPPGPKRFDGVVAAGTVTADSLVLAGRAFDFARVEGTHRFSGAGDARIHVVRSEDERYDAEVAVALDGSRRSVAVDQLRIRAGQDVWALRRPAAVAWSPAGVEVADFALHGSQTGLSVRADGRVAAAEGESTLDVDVTGLDLGALGKLLQSDAWPQARVSAQARLRGAAGAPRWTAQLRAADARHGTLAFDEIAAQVSYEGDSVAGRVEASVGARRALLVEGSLPADFRLDAPGPLFPDGDLALDVVADSLPAELALRAVGSLEEIGGVFDGRVQVRGLLSAPEPSGRFSLAGGTAWVAPLGVRLSALNLEFGLTPDGVAAVAGSGRSGGSVRIQGAVDVADPTDPAFDLAFWPQELQIVDRRDMVAAVSGDSITLTGSFSYPLIQGVLAVDGGAVFVEELRRSSEVVDFYDHALSAAARTVDMAGGRRTASERALSPFLSNLRVLVDMDIGRGSWLRSRDFNVETEGNLVVTYDRENNQLILQGDMGVVRGTYSRLPRTLSITDGLFRFVGRTADFNPEIAIAAQTRLRTRDGQPLTITADVSGSLVAPQVSLSSDAESAISEADLYSYLLLGQPTSALLGQPRTTSVGAGTNLLLGQVASQIGYLLALRLDVDHLSVSQAEQTQANAAFGASSIQIEVGRYVRDNVFLTGVYQRGICADPKLPVNSVGVRLEVDMPRDMTLEGFLEDRCTREGFRGLGGLSLERAQIWGIAFYRDWGY